METEHEELLRLRLENLRFRIAVAETPQNKRALWKAITWRGSRGDWVTDLLAAIRKRAGIED